MSFFMDDIEDEGEKTEVSSHYESFLSLFDDEDEDSIGLCRPLEVGVPRVLRFKVAADVVPVRCGSVLATALAGSSNEATELFFHKSLNEYLQAGDVCQFCHETTRKWPEHHHADEETNKKKYCCEDYKCLVQAMVTHTNMVDSLRKRLSKRIDIRPRPKYRGSLETLSEEDIEARLKEIKRLQSLFTKKETSEKSVNSRSMTRASTMSVEDIKMSYDSFANKAKEKIRYELSDRLYIEQGWTVLTEQAVKRKSPTQLEPQQTPPYEPSAVQLSQAKQKRYRNGAKFQIFLNDGSGNVYYPNGRLACVVSQDHVRRLTQLFLFDVGGRLAGTFDSRGLLSLNHASGRTRCQLEPDGGRQFDQSGLCVKRWRWRASDPLTFRPVIFTLNNYMSVHITSRHRITLCLRSRQGGCKFLFQLPKQASSSSSIEPASSLDTDNDVDEEKVEEDNPAGEHVRASKARIAELLNGLRSAVVGNDNECQHRHRQPPLSLRPVASTTSTTASSRAVRLPSIELSRRRRDGSSNCAVTNRRRCRLPPSLTNYDDDEHRK